MIKKLLPFLFIICALPVSAQQPKEVVYYGFDPDIITNYITSNRRSLGYIRVNIELMVDDRQHLKTIEHHEPLILDTIISTLSRQPEDKIKSLTGREEIRLLLLEQLQQMMQREAGNALVRDILFTKYLYQ